VGWADENSSDFVALQKDDPSLAKWWNEAKKGNPLFVIKDGVLFRNGVVGGVQVIQLALPESKRKQVVAYAHDSIFSLHFSVPRTMDRVLSYFHFPGVHKLVQSYVGSCDMCQKHARKLRTDKTPIQAIPLATQAFHTCEVDLITGVEPPSGRGHHHILTYVCLQSRWVDAEPLKTLTAMEACEALISIFLRTSIPRICIADCGTNFMAGLSQELFRRLGIEFRSSSPWHSRSHGLV
jgi:hypothetical protein